MKKILIFLIFSSHLVSAQNEITLEQCHDYTRENYPNLKQSGLLEKIAELNQENIRTSSLPSINLSGQATWQSDVTKIGIPVQGIKIPEVPNDQYKIYIEARQNIWDGGISKMQEKLEAALLKTVLNQVESELYQLKEQVNEVFFTAMLLVKQQEILDKQSETLAEKLKQVTSAVKNGISEESNKWVLEAELLALAQQKEKAEAGHNAALSILSLLTGREITYSNTLVFKSVILQENKPLARPELELFGSRRDQLTARSLFTERLRYPKFFGFGQIGYGRPGLNMLSNQFDSFYLVGVGLSWNVWDFGKVQREKEGMGFQKQIISTQEETFKRNISIMLARQRSTIGEISSSIEKDKQIAALRKSVAEVTASKLKNGIAAASDYIRDLNAETIAMLNLETHRLQLEEAKIKYNTIQGY